MRRRSPTVDCCLDAPVTRVSFLSIEQSGLWRQAASPMMTAKALSAASRATAGATVGIIRLAPFSTHGGEVTLPPGGAMNPLSRRRHLQAS